MVPERHSEGESSKSVGMPSQACVPQGVATVIIKPSQATSFLGGFCWGNFKCNTPTLSHLDDHEDGSQDDGRRAERTGAGHGHRGGHCCSRAGRRRSARHRGAFGRLDEDAQRHQGQRHLHQRELHKCTTTFARTRALRYPTIFEAGIDTCSICYIVRGIGAHARLYRPSRCCTTLPVRESHLQLSCLLSSSKALWPQGFGFGSLRIIECTACYQSYGMMYITNH